MNCKIRKTIQFVTFVLISKMTFAQSNQLPKALYGTPDLYQGYFVFDAVNNPNVRVWVVDVFQLITIDDTLKTLFQIDKISARESSYLKINPRYFYSGTEIIYTISGLDVSGSIIAHDQWEFVPEDYKYFKEVCGRTCNGKTYAYRISISGEHENEQLTNQNGHKVELRGTVQSNLGYGIYLPFYRNMSSTEKAVMCQFGGNTIENNHMNWNTPKHYGQTHCAYPDGVQMIQIAPSQLPLNLKDKDGYTIPNDIVRFRIPKTLGYWSQQSSANNYDGHVFAMLAQDKCGEMGVNANSITGYTNYANQILNLDNTLFCDGSFSPGSPMTSNPQQGKDTVYIEGLPWDDKPKDIYQILAELYVEWIGNNGSPFPSSGNTTGAPWWPTDSLVNIQLYRIDAKADNIPDGPVFEQSRNALFKPNGEPNVASIELEKGLYNLLLTFEDERTFPMIFNVAEKMYNSYALSNYLDVNIFPVPLPIEDWFSISFKALATLKFDYYIHDEQGNQLVNRKFVLHKDHERTTKINAKNLPSGLLFHKFVFEDNSIIQMTTIKQ